jgi:hypothetical protein
MHAGPGVFVLGPLALREAELRDGADPIFQVQTKSPAISGSNGPPRLDPPPMRALDPR